MTKLSPLDVLFGILGTLYWEVQQGQEIVNTVPLLLV
jgi:hypothetical protein